MHSLDIDPSIIYQAIMQHIEIIKRTPAVSFYEFKGNYEGGCRRLLCSTPETRDICNKPEISGCQYTDLLLNGMVSILKGLPFKSEILDQTKDEEICILNFLRGGLNFDLRKAINKAYGFNHHRTSFMTSQRFKENDRWGVKENSYRKFMFPKGSVVFIADVVATGVTVDNALQVVFDHIEKEGGSIKYLVFFTIGCHKLEKILDKYKKILQEKFDDFKECYAVYLEGKFKLIDSKTNLKIGIQGTDLVRFDCPVTPEFELSQYEKISHALERCTIYDAGSRAFDVPEYTDDVRKYWGQVKLLAKKGLTLYDALKERWHENEYSSKEAFFVHKKGIWKGIDELFLDQLYDAYQKRWSKDFIEKSKSTTALIEICEEQLAKL
ncbi:phosphoribosyltransferase [bacterium]|nr:phosphoribosyltransferase [bacterium]